MTHNPVDRMLSDGAHHMPLGTWSDDSSMMLCTLASITEKRSLDFHDIMMRFSRWAKEGYLTPHGKAFGIGRTTLKALGRFWHGEEALHCGCSSEKDNGNGSLMRILPVVLYHSLVKPKLSIEEKIYNIHAVSSLTHAHSRSKIACGIYSFVLEELIRENKKQSVQIGLQKAREYYKNDTEIQMYERLFTLPFETVTEDNIKSSGYVVDTLEAAIWCVLNSDSYRECVLRAVNLGGDTDTIAAVAGGIAGAIYRFETLPQEWLKHIVFRSDIQDMCSNFGRMICGDNHFSSDILKSKYISSDSRRGMAS